MGLERLGTDTRRLIEVVAIHVPIKCLFRRLPKSIGFPRIYSFKRDPCGWQLSRFEIVVSKRDDFTARIRC